MMMNMFGIQNISAAKLLLVNTMAVVTLSLPKCFEITDVSQPETALVEEVITIEVDVELTGKEGDRLVFAFLAPRAWSAAKNTTVHFTSSIGGSNMSLMDPEELDPANEIPWAEQIETREGIGQNYGEVEWVVYKADDVVTPPGTVSPDNPANGTVFIETKVGASNMTAQLGYFIGEAFWGYLEDGNNSISYFYDPCIEISGAAGQPQNLCGPAPRSLIELNQYTFEDILTIKFDAQEDSTALIGADQVFFCSTAIFDSGKTEICETSTRTEMISDGDDIWYLTIWGPEYYSVPTGETISEVLCSFRDKDGTVVKDPSGNDFQILVKCFQ